MQPPSLDLSLMVVLGRLVYVSMAAQVTGSNQHQVAIMGELIAFSHSSFMPSMSLSLCTTPRQMMDDWNIVFLSLSMMVFNNNLSFPAMLLSAHVELLAKTATVAYALSCLS